MRSRGRPRRTAARKARGKSTPGPDPPAKEPGTGQHAMEGQPENPENHGNEVSGAPPNRSHAPNEKRSERHQCATRKRVPRPRRCHAVSRRRGRPVRRPDEKPKRRTPNRREDREAAAEVDRGTATDPKRWSGTGHRRHVAGQGAHDRLKALGESSRESPPGPPPEQSRARRRNRRATGNGGPEQSLQGTRKRDRGRRPRRPGNTPEGARRADAGTMEERARDGLDRRPDAGRAKSPELDRKAWSGSALRP